MCTSTNHTIWNNNDATGGLHESINTSTNQPLKSIYCNEISKNIEANNKTNLINSIKIKVFDILIPTVLNPPNVLPLHRFSSSFGHWIECWARKNKPRERAPLFLWMNDLSKKCVCVFFVFKKKNNLLITALEPWSINY